uniref:Uncharacterized protein n=1 Tax=Magallana gigas TaxID=29159 RepID=A0A8W8J1I3_MAGGI
MDKCIIVAICIVIDSKAQAAKCLENGIEVCCSGYILNKTSGHCDKCPAGYTGMDCAYRCHYPTYGEDCFMTCECSTDLCDFVSGCKVTSTAVTSSEHQTTDRKGVVFPCDVYRNYCGKNNISHQF